MNNLAALVEHLALLPSSVTQQWHEWRVEPVSGGANNLIYRATSEAGDFAIKFTTRDERDRAGRKYTALWALEEAETEIAPHAVWLERTRFRQPVVVQTWLEGTPLLQPPQDDAGMVCTP